MKEIRVHGRGGQGAVTTAQLLAIAGFEDGKYTQAFPAFGVERRGAPVQAFARISENPINIRSQIYEPDYVLVLDPSLVGPMVTSGLKSGGQIIINSALSPEELDLRGDFTVHSVDATALAVEILGVPIVNTAIIGAFAAFTKEISLNAAKKSVHQRFSGKLADKNELLVEKIYGRVINGE